MSHILLMGLPLKCTKPFDTRSLYVRHLLIYTVLKWSSCRTWRSGSLDHFFATLLKPHTYIRESNCPVSLHNSLHLIQRPVIPAAELEAQAPVGRQLWQSHKLQVESKNPTHCQWRLCGQLGAHFPRSKLSKSIWIIYTKLECVKFNLF